MRLFLAGLAANANEATYNIIHNERQQGRTILLLESYAYIRKKEEKVMKFFEPATDNFLLDSGAFTFLNSGKRMSWEEYVDEYADFINRYNVKRFFELDIDPIVGYSKVLELRRRLEEKTGKQCIPVWHKSRGKDEFIRMCREYSYVSIGGIVTKEIAKTEHKFFTWFIKTAHENGAKIHGLGYTSLKELSKYHFDSVDSTTWVGGGKFGNHFLFRNGVMKRIPKSNPNTRVKDKTTSDNHNFKEWLKFQQFAFTNL